MSELSPFELLCKACAEGDEVKACVGRVVIETADPYFDSPAKST